MSVKVPNRAITQRICVALRAGEPMDVACTAVGVDAPTLKRWLALGEAAYLECEEEDPHCRFFEAFIKALEYADQALETKDRKPIAPDPLPPSRPRSEPQRSGVDWSADHPPLAWLVVEEAPIEIVIGSRPPWVYETVPASTVVRSPEPRQSIRPDIVPSEPTSGSSVEIEETALRHGLTRGEIAAILLVAAIALVVVLALILAAIPVVLVGFILVGSTRCALALVYRWRSGLMALCDGAIKGLPIRNRVSWSVPRGRSDPLGMVCSDRTAGSVAFSGRLRPQRE